MTDRSPIEGPEPPSNGAWSGWTRSPSIQPVEFTDATHDGGHIPPPASDETWQESWYTGWFDPVAKAAGFYHLGLQRNRGIADLWNWTAVDGEVAGKYQSLSIPLPEDDLSDLHLPGVHIQTLKPLLSYQVDAQYSSGVSSSVVYEAFTPPFSFSLTDHTTDLGDDHYESCGRVRGFLQVDDRQIEVEAYAFQDHSWGSRVFASLLSHRWSYAVFGEDLFLSVAKFTGRAAPTRADMCSTTVTSHAVVHRGSTCPAT